MWKMQKQGKKSDTENMAGPREQRRGGSISQVLGGHAEMGTQVRAMWEALEVQMWKQLHPAAAWGTWEPVALRKRAGVCARVQRVTQTFEESSLRCCWMLWLWCPLGTVVCWSTGPPENGPKAQSAVLAHSHGVKNPTPANFKPPMASKLAPEIPEYLTISSHQLAEQAPAEPSGRHRKDAFGISGPLQNITSNRLWAIFGNKHSYFSLAKWKSATKEFFFGVLFSYSVSIGMFTKQREIFKRAFYSAHKQNAPRALKGRLCALSGACWVSHVVSAQVHLLLAKTQHLCWTARIHEKPEVEQQQPRVHP